MIALAYIVLLGWLPAVVFLFTMYPAQQAVITAFIGGWMFLPQLSIALPLIPDYDRISATCYGILIGTTLFDSKRFTLFRPNWIDIPMAIWCLCPFVTSLTNQLGAYDGVVQVLSQTITWGLPYFVGRIYLNDFIGLRKLGLGALIGALIYTPLCLFESRSFMSLHQLIYGFQVSSQNIALAIRYGGYRPSVFMESGLMLSVWMLLGTLMAIAFWRAGVVKKVWNIPIATVAIGLVVIFILIRSTGAYMLFALAVVILYLAKWLRTSFLMWVITALICAYLYLGATGNFPRKEVVGALSTAFNPERIQSVDFRFANEEFLSEKARQQIVFGWGGFGRNRVYDPETGRDISVTDSLWIIVFGTTGIVGLVCIFTALLLPSLMFCIRVPAQYWAHPMVAPAAALAVSVVMYAIDCVLNAMFNPVFSMICGGIAGLVVSQRRK